MLNIVDPIGRGELSYLEFIHVTVAIVVQLFAFELSWILLVNIYLQVKFTTESLTLSE